VRRNVYGVYIRTQLSRQRRILRLRSWIGTPSWSASAFSDCTWRNSSTAGACASTSRVNRHRAAASTPVSPPWSCAASSGSMVSSSSTAGDGRCGIRAKSPSTPPSARSASAASARQICVSSCRGAEPAQNRRAAWRSASRSCPALGGSADASDWIFRRSIWAAKKRRSAGRGGSGAARREVATAHACGDRCRARSHWLAARREAGCAPSLSAWTAAARRAWSSDASAASISRGGGGKRDGEVGGVDSGAGGEGTEGIGPSGMQSRTDGCGTRGFHIFFFSRLLQRIIRQH
jgi:hypothetical protein